MAENANTVSRRALIATTIAGGALLLHPPEISHYEVPNSYRRDDEPEASFELSLEGRRFMADGKEVVMRGAVMNHFLFNSPIEAYHKDISWLKQHGANFAAIQWNSGFLEREGYIEGLVAACEFAKKQGVRVELSLHSRGLKEGSDWDPQQIQVVDDQIIEDWHELLKDPANASRLAQAVDIFSPLSEPNLTDTGEKIRWKMWRPLGEECGNEIRKLLKRDSALISICGVDLGSDAWDVFHDPLTISNAVIEIHPYNWFSKGVNYKEFIQAMHYDNKPVFVGEMGLSDPVDFVEDQYRYFTDNNISYAFYAMNSSSDDEIVLISGEKVNETGKLAVKYFEKGKSKKSSD